MNQYGAINRAGSQLDKKNFMVEKLINLLWESRRYISIKLSEEVLEKLKELTHTHEHTAYVDRQVILQKSKHRFEMECPKGKALYFVEVSIINNKACIVALE